MEKGNTGKIIFMRGTEGFYIVAGHSAVMLANKFAKDLKMRVPLKQDTDFEFRFPEGKISVKNLGYYKKKLVESGMFEIESETPEFCILKLKKKLSKTEYEILAQAKELRRQQLEKEVLSNIPMPKTHATITEAVRVAFKMFSKYTDKDAKETFGKRMMEEVRTAQKIFLLVCTGRMPLEKGIFDSTTYIDYALVSITQMMEIGIWNVEDAAVVSTALIETKLSMKNEEKMARELIEKMNNAKGTLVSKSAGAAKKKGEGE